MQMTIQQPSEFNHLLTQLQISDTAAEFHGFLSGLVAGGIKDDSWQTLTYQFTNDGHAFSQVPLKALCEFYQQLQQSYEETNTLFSLWFPQDEDGFALADSIAEWTSHFLLGLGLAQPMLQKEQDEDIVEALNDLEEIAKLGYEEDEDSTELLEAGEEVVEYLRGVALLFHSHFSVRQTQLASQTKTQLH